MAAAGLVVLGGAIPWAVGVLIFQGPAVWQAALVHWALLLAAVIAAVAAVAFAVRLVWFGQFSSKQPVAVGERVPFGRDLTAGDFDAQATVLLQRALEATDAVTASDVCQAGLLDQLALCSALAAHEREIALALREQSQLRQARAGLPPIAGNSAAAELLDQQHVAARLAEQSIAGRVAALEQLAAEVGRADIAYRDRRAHVAVSELADRHLDMLARTAADVHAIDDIVALSRQALLVRIALGDMHAG